MMNMDGLRCVVVGGGKAAKRKIAALLEAEAEIVVISPDIDPSIEEWVRAGQLAHMRKSYEGKADLREARLVIAATDADEVNNQVCSDAMALGVLVNNTGQPAEGTVNFPAVLRRGGLVMTVSTSGASPGLAVRLRDELMEQYGPEYERYVDFLAEFRQQVLTAIDDPEVRALFFQKVLQFDILDIIRQGELDAFRANLWTELINELSR